MSARSEVKLAGFIKHLESRENESVIKAMAFMAYNPSIGRVLAKNGVKSFAKMATSRVAVLSHITSAEDFDSFHHSWVTEIITKIHRNARGGSKKISYGQAQKPINVFLKLYVDWAHQPDEKTARRLLPWLHVPLDSIVMKNLSKKFSKEFNRDIHPLQGKSYSLSKIDRELYYCWQNLFRTKYSIKPLLFDIVWSTRRGHAK